MARRPFGGTTADVAQDTAGDRVSGAQVTVWTAATGGTKLTDLQTPAGAALAGGVVTSDANGIIAFLGPADGTAVVYLDGGLGGRTKMLATDLADRVGTLESTPGGVVSVAGRSGAVTLSKADVGLGSVDNTADASKPVSTAQQAALDLKASLASPVFTGNPQAPTPTAGDNDTSIATTAFVAQAVGSSLASPTPASAGYDVFLLMGQSNMVGYSGASTWDYTNYDLHDINVWQWDSATATVKAGYDPLAFNDGGGSGVSPAMAFARWWSTIHLGRRVLLVPAAIGGTGFTGTAPNVWDSTVSPSLYTQAVAKANAAIAAAQTLAPASSVAGFLWMQGEADGWASRTQAQYAANLDALIDAVRANVTGATSSTPFILGRMVPEFIGSAGSLTSAQIDAAHADTPRRKAYTWAASGVSGSANHDGTSTFHYTASGARALGHRMFFALTNALANTGSASIVPDPPSYPLAVLNGTSGTILTWLPATSNATITGYQVWRSTTSGAETLLATLGNVLTYTDNTATTDQTTYYYKVKAVSATGTSAFSTEASIQFSAQTTIAADTFNRADSTTTNNASTLGTTDTGAKAWTYRTGFQIRVSSNTALLVGATGSSPACATVDAGVADVDVSTTILSASASDSEGVVVRYVDESNYVFLHVYSSTQYELMKVVSGTATNILDTAGVNTRIVRTPAANDVVRLVAKGSVYTVFINGTQVGQVTDAGPSTTATNVGLRQVGATFAAKFDNFSVKTAP